MRIGLHAWRLSVCCLCLTVQRSVAATAASPSSAPKAELASPLQGLEVFGGADLLHGRAKITLKDRTGELFSRGPDDLQPLRSLSFDFADKTVSLFPLKLSAAA